MNIEGVNLLSLLPGNSTIEGGAQPFPENGVIPDGFSNALMGQIGLLSDANGQIELSGQLSNMNMPKPIGDLPTQKGNEEELAAFIDNLSYKKNEPVGLNEDVDLEATLLALTNALKAMTPGKDAINPASSPDKVAAIIEDVSLALTDALKTMTPVKDTINPASSPDKVAAIVEDVSLALTAALKAMTPVKDTINPASTSDKTAIVEDVSLALTYARRDTINPASTPDETAMAQDMSFALTYARKAITPDISTDETATAQNMNEIMAFNGLSFVKPLPEEAKLNMPGVEEASSGDFLQKETVLRQSIQDKQGFNLASPGNAEPAEKTLVLEKQTALSGIEKASPGATADMFTLHRSVDNKTESPAITKPLTHPGWSKDLGEQIVWMNNKAISTAEIRLNPEHLGPISVRIDVNQDQTTILFTAQHADVKEALEASIPKLREMLSAQQLNLTSVNISQNSTSDQGRSQQQTFAKTPENRGQGTEGVTDTIEKTEHELAVVSKGLLSIYA